MKKIITLCAITLFLASSAYANPFGKPFTGGSGTGDAVGPGSSTDGGVALYDGVTGKLLKDSTVVVDQTLDAATGNEVAWTFPYTVNKLTSGNDTGFLLNKTDTNSPGTSYLIDAQVGGVSKFSVSHTGGITGAGLDLGVGNATIGGGIIGTNNATFNIRPSQSVNSDTEAFVRVGSGGLYNSTSGTVYGIDINASATIGAGSANIRPLAITPTYNFAGAQTGTVTDIFVNATETDLQGATHNLMDLQRDSVSRFSVDNNGYVQHQGCFGELYETAGATNIAVTTGGTFYQWVNSTVGLESGNGFVDCDAATDDCIIESATCAGTYNVQLSMSFTGSNAGIIECQVAVNDTEQAKIGFERALAATASIGSASAGGLLSLSNGDAVTVECTSDGNGDVVTPHILNMSMTKIDS